MILHQYFKWFQEILIPMGLKEYFQWFQESLMGSTKSIIKLDRITEWWNITSLSKISDIGLLWFSYVFRYFRSVAECFMVDFYEQEKSIFRMYMPSSMMHVTAKIPQFCIYFDSESVADSYQRNAKIIMNILNIDFIFYWLTALILNKEDRQVQWLFFC